MKKIALLIGAVALFGAGCFPTPAPSTTPLDMSKVNCNNLAEARQQVAETYRNAVTEAADTLQKAVEAFQADLNSCTAAAWKGGPCDKEWKESQTALTAVQGDIMNDVAYNGWKKAKANFEACFAEWDTKYADWAAKGAEREQLCRDEFNAKRSAAITAHEDAVKAAASQRDADLAKLDEFEKSCKEKAKTATGVGVTGGSGTVTTPPTGTPTPANRSWMQVPSTVPASACRQAVPGEQGTPRTGRAPDFGPKDIAINLITTVAEEVTKTPLPISAIDSQIFAGMVVVKIRTRIAEMIIEESDAQLSGDRKTELMLRDKIRRYRAALEIWGKIAEGRPALPEIKKDVARVQTMPSGMCKSDADCAAPLCCSAKTIALSHCNEYGSCVAQVNACPPEDICMGPDYTEPRFDHCGPLHEGNWGYGQSMPAGSPANRPAPGRPR